MSRRAGAAGCAGGPEGCGAAGLLATGAIGLLITGAAGLFAAGGWAEAGLAGEAAGAVAAGRTGASAASAGALGAADRDSTGTGAAGAELTGAAGGAITGAAGALEAGGAAVAGADGLGGVAAGADGLVAAGGAGAAGFWVAGGADGASTLFRRAASTSPGLDILERSILVLIPSTPPRADLSSLLPVPCPEKCLRTTSASSASSELEWVFFSVTPTAGRMSRIALLLTSSSLARSLIRILLIRPTSLRFPLSSHCYPTEFILNRAFGPDKFYLPIHFGWT